MALSRKQILFAQFFKGDPLEAAIRAGYSKKRAPLAAEENMANPDIQRVIKSEAINNQESSESFDPLMPIGELPDLIKSRLARQTYWASIMTGKYETTNERLKASELLAKSCGDFIEPSNPSTDMPPPTLIVIKAGKEEIEIKQEPIKVALVAPDD